MPRTADDSRRGNQKGANVSTDDDEDVGMDDVRDALLPDVCPPASATAPTPTEPDISGRSSASRSSLDDVKLGEVISHIEQSIDHVDRDRDSNRLGYEEYADSSRRQRHTSYNVSGDKEDVADIVINTDDTQLKVDSATMQAEKLKTIQAQIENINHSLTPLTRELLAPSNLYAETTTSSSSFVQHDRTTEEISRARKTDDINAGPAANDHRPDLISLSSIGSESQASSSYSRSESITDNERDLEYIHGRPDLRSQLEAGSGFSVKGEIDSDNYHHHRRFSETNDQLKYIRGRADWKIKTDCENMYIVTIRDQIDSDEYHHARRMSECLDLAYSSRLLAGAKDGTVRTPFLDLNYRSPAAEFERAVSENREIAEERVISSERLIRSKPLSRNLSPAAIHILIEDTSLPNSGDAETWQEVHMPELDAPGETTAGWDLEQFYAEDRRRSMVKHQNTLDDAFVEVEVSRSDQEADREVANIFKTSITESTQEASVSDLSDHSADDDNSSTGHIGGKMKKSKTTRNLLAAERLSVDLSANEPALKAIADKSDELKQLRLNQPPGIAEEASGSSALIRNETKPGHSSAKPTLPGISQSRDFMSNEKASASPNVPRTPRTPLTPLTPRTPTMDELLQETSIGPWFRKPPQENVDDLLQETSMGPWFHN